MEDRLVVVALYPDGVYMSQMYLPFAGIPGYEASDKMYNLAMDHYYDVLEWCSANCQGPWECGTDDILYLGVRVRLGTMDDFTYFNLKWNCR